MSNTAWQIANENVDLATRKPEHLWGISWIALLDAARAYNPDRGVPFRAYASRRIDFAIKDQMRFGTVDHPHRAMARSLAGPKVTGKYSTDAHVVPVEDTSVFERASAKPHEGPSDKDLELVGKIMNGPGLSRLAAIAYVHCHRLPSAEQMQLRKRNGTNPNRPVRISSRAIAAAIGVSENRVSQWVADIRRKGIVTRLGGNKKRATQHQSPGV